MIAIFASSTTATRVDYKDDSELIKIAKRITGITKLHRMTYTAVVTGKKYRETVTDAAIRALILAYDAEEMLTFDTLKKAQNAARRSFGLHIRAALGLSTVNAPDPKRYVNVTDGISAFAAEKTKLLAYLRSWPRVGKAWQEPDDCKAFAELFSGKLASGVDITADMPRLESGGGGMWKLMPAPARA